MQTQLPIVQTEKIETKVTQAIDVTSLPTMAEVERQYLTMVLEQTGGNKVQTAKILGLTVKTIYNKLNAYKADETLRTNP